MGFVTVEIATSRHEKLDCSPVATAIPCVSALLIAAPPTGPMLLRTSPTLDNVLALLNPSATRVAAVVAAPIPDVTPAPIAPRATPFQSKLSCMPIAIAAPCEAAAPTAPPIAAAPTPTAAALAPANEPVSAAPPK